MEGQTLPKFSSSQAMCACGISVRHEQLAQIACLLLQVSERQRKIHTAEHYAVVKMAEQGFPFMHYSYCPEGMGDCDVVVTLVHSGVQLLVSTCCPALHTLPTLPCPTELPCLG